MYKQVRVLTQVLHGRSLPHAVLEPVMVQRHHQPDHLRDPEPELPNGLHQDPLQHGW